MTLLKQSNETEMQVCNTDDINSIYVDSTVRNHIKSVRSKSHFFDSPIKYKVTDDFIVFERTTPLYDGRTIKPKRDKNGWWRFQIEADSVPTKKYDFEEESNEDCVIVYFR